MLDMKFVRENPELIKRNLTKRGDLNKVVWVDNVLDYDREWRRRLTEANELRKRRNTITEEVAKLKKEGREVAEKVREAETIPNRIKQLEQETQNYSEKVDYILLRLPNIMHETVPIGKDDNDNVTIRTWGDIPRFYFKPKDHIDLLLNLDLVDLERAAKVAGARFYYLKNELVQLNYALLKYALDFIVRKGFTVVQPPYTIKREAIAGAVALSDFEDVIF